LTLTPVGVGGAYARPGEAQSAYLVACGETRVCLDLGAGTLNRLQQIVAPETLTAIAISHVHPDHCVDLFSLRVYMEWGPGKGHRQRVLGPAGLQGVLTGFTGDDGWESFAFEAMEEPAGAAEIGSLTLSWVEVPHCKPTFAMRLDHAGGAIVYGADCGPNDALTELASDADILIAECSLGTTPAGADAIHMSGADAGALARRANVRRLLLTHCYPEHDRDAVLAQAEQAFGGPVAWARQGEQVDLSIS
jgi:ribonuclease BN (tRNA processing enzyme)